MPLFAPRPVPFVTCLPPLAKNRRRICDFLLLSNPPRELHALFYLSAVAAGFTTTATVGPCSGALQAGRSKAVVMAQQCKPRSQDGPSTPRHGGRASPQVRPARCLCLSHVVLVGNGQQSPLPNRRPPIPSACCSSHTLNHCERTRPFRGSPECHLACALVKDSHMAPEVQPSDGRLCTVCTCNPLSARPMVFPAAQTDHAPCRSVAAVPPRAVCFCVCAPHTAGTWQPAPPIMSLAP